MINFEMIQILRALKNETGSTLAKKRLPVKLIMAKNKYINELDKAYETYEKTLTDLCENYHVDTNKIEENNNPEFQQELNNLLNAEIFVTLPEVDLTVFEQCDTDKYDALSSDEFNILSYMIKNESEEE